MNSYSTLSHRHSHGVCVLWTPLVPHPIRSVQATCHCMHVCVCVCVCVGVCVGVGVGVGMCVGVCAGVCVCVCMHVRTHACVWGG